jgi:hypothetical protein
MSDPLLLTPVEAARMLGVPTRRLGRLHADGLKYVTIAGHTRYRERDLRKWESMKIAVSAPFPRRPVARPITPTPPPRKAPPLMKPKTAPSLSARQEAESALSLARRAQAELAVLKLQYGAGTTPSTPARGLPPAQKAALDRVMGLHDPGPATVKRQGNRLILGAHANDPAPVAKLDPKVMREIMDAEPKAPGVERRGNRLVFGV